MPIQMTPPPPTLFCLHLLGGSAREWDELAVHLGERALCVPFDLPGFGSAANLPGASVSEMADFIADRIASNAPARWWIAGHSMGAKVALALARRAEDGDRTLAGFGGAVLLAGSPPSPEPMSDGKRRDMVAWISAEDDIRAARAADFIDQNIGSPISDAAKASAVADVLRANPTAWTAWLEEGSREDWCRRIGILQSPALVLSGSEDADLGPSAQVCLMLPHLKNGRHVVIEGAGHLLPLERPKVVAELIAESLSQQTDRVLEAGKIPEPYEKLIDSPRVNSRLRSALQTRATPFDQTYNPSVLDALKFSVLATLIDRVLPQAEDHPIDIAARIDMRLRDGTGDGWRFADLPSDSNAYSLALRTLDAAARTAHGVGFVALSDPDKDALIETVAKGELPLEQGQLDPSQMKLWFEDLRSDVVRIYLAHPKSLATIGFGGIAAGGDDLIDLTGFSDLEIDAREPWEPVATAEAVR